LRQLSSFRNCENTKISTFAVWIGTGYPILKFSDVPEPEIVLINRPEMPPLGAGEPSIISVPAAIANAIFNATGACLREAPFTPQRVVAAMRGSSAGS
jgi:CO/xanthine dehydrogenase Mo-binding subunit